MKNPKKLFKILLLSTKHTLNLFDEKISYVNNQQ